ncbi:MAG: HesA/MoeB/ThiF family protein [Planctomycetota bacterium]
MIDTIDHMPEFVGLPAGVDPRAVFADTRVLILGVGSVGARAALHCGRCGVGDIVLVDGKRFTENYTTQAIRGPGDVGKPKASRVGRWVKAICPEARVRAFDTPLEKQPLSLVDDCDAVIASTDNLAAEVEIGRRCLALGIPLIYSSVHGPSLTVQLRTYTNRGPEGPCPACAFSPGEWDQLNGEVRFSCDPASRDDNARITGPPTVSVSPLCSLGADLAVLELLRMRLKLGPAPEDRVTQYNCYGHTTMVSGLAFNPRCPVDHTVLNRAGVGRPLADCSLRDLAAAAGVTDDGAIADASFAVDGLVFALMAACPTCGATQQLGRFVRRGERLRRKCRECGGHGMVAHPFYSFERCVPDREGLMSRLDEPLGPVGAAARSVIVRGSTGAVLVRHRPDNGGKTP